MKHSVGLVVAAITLGACASVLGIEQKVPPADAGIDAGSAAPPPSEDAGGPATSSADDAEAAPRDAAVD